MLMTSAPKVGCGEYGKMDQWRRRTGYEFVREGLKVVESLIKAQAKVLVVEVSHVLAPREISTHLWPSKLVYDRTIHSSGAVVNVVCGHIMESLFISR